MPNEDVGGTLSKGYGWTVNDFNASLPFDCRMFREDITGSMAHAEMLGKCGIISSEDSALLVKTLGELP